MKKSNQLAIMELKSENETYVLPLLWLDECVSETYYSNFDDMVFSTPYTIFAYETLGNLNAVSCIITFYGNELQTAFFDAYLDNVRVTGGGPGEIVAIVFSMENTTAITMQIRKKWLKHRIKMKKLQKIRSMKKV